MSETPPIQYTTTMAKHSKRLRQLTPVSDMDGDSTMHSSPSLNENDDDEMFPDEALSHNPNPDPYPRRPTTPP
ncbi:hypothetical protein N0V83_006941 [Neocucurbitaria cava]|uniref:Uncharacterized protein n=1 Tax=Neocucurbitaria cava TaxID=798079 RepID=A0A9W8Y5E1_9PLEO|nr:hypothetical protein N0V83_006941 [Neocucurbitaria cava]